ncbi:hypothetical protein LQV63_15005 [Paenibacillus profundus]|uniref:Uncharacterized protein n=1 Tax=Paenibacillus profundus TaxID=1173085 RepID=A0ABS8YF40_9BACL|nr:hypothetical protein [Paenibacillus profundus]MCE5170623.1 hypothetical protein [Paenibacillus profundus]
MENSLQIFNRQNTMLYREQEKTFMKSHFKELEVKMTDATHQVLIELLSASKEGIPLKTLEHIIQHSDFMKMVKLLYEAGSIFLYPGSIPIDKVASSGWFHILTQYLPPDKKLSDYIDRVNRITVWIDDAVNKLFPRLRSLLQESGISVSLSHELPYTPMVNDWVITMNREEVAGRNNTIVVSVHDHAVSGFKYSKEVLIPESTGKPDLINKNSLLYKTAPLYLFIYIAKTVFGLSKHTFTLNKEGRFFEQDLAPNHLYDTVPHLNVQTINEAKDKLDDINGFETFIAKNILPLKISGHLDAYSDLVQVGFTTYGIQHKESEYGYVYAGTDYPLTAFTAIKRGLRHHFHTQVSKDWLVTDAENYYYDKVLYLLNHFDEPFHIIELDRNKLDTSSLTVIYGKRLNIEYNVFLKVHHLSSAAIVYLYMPSENRYYTDGNKTSEIKEKIDEIFINYVVKQCNPEADFSGMLHVLESIELEAEPPRYDRPGFIHHDRQRFIEKSLGLFKKYNIRYEERAWRYEEELKDANLLVRKIMVGEYS